MVCYFHSKNKYDIFSFFLALIASIFHLMKATKICGKNLFKRWKWAKLSKVLIKLRFLLPILVIVFNSCKSFFLFSFLFVGLFLSLFARSNSLYKTNLLRRKDFFFFLDIQCLMYTVISKTKTIYTLLIHVIYFCSMPLCLIDNDTSVSMCILLYIKIYT